MIILDIILGVLIGIPLCSLIAMFIIAMDNLFKDEP